MGGKSRTRIARPKREPVQNIATKDRPYAFLEALERTGSITESCRVSGYPRRSAYDRREDDAEFAAAWDKARQRGADALEDEAVRRAREGIDKPIFQTGKLVGYVREFSDTLLIFLLKGLKPEKFRDRRMSTEITGKDGGPIEVSNVRERIASRLARLGAGAAPPSDPGATHG